MPARNKVVCVPCRKVWGGGGSSNSRASDKRILTAAPTGGCPHCKQPTVSVSYRWRAPKRRDDRAWKRIEQGDWLTEEDPKDRTRHWYADLPLGRRKRDKAAQTAFERDTEKRMRR